jgi:hypothetical protein
MIAAGIEFTRLPLFRRDYWGTAVVHGYRIKPSQWQAAVLAALLAAMLLVLPHQARAAGLFDFLLGGFQRPTPPANVNSYAPPPPGIDRVAPAPLGSESVRQDGGNIGRTLAFCVQLCDGQHFPMEHINATPSPRSTSRRN